MVLDAEERKCRHAESCREWREKNREKSRETTRQWKKDNPERSLEHAKKYREKNRERACEASRKWRMENPERAHEMAKKWREENPDRVRELMQFNRELYRARKRCAPGADYTTSELVDARWDYYGGQCYLCGGEADSIDHVIPLSKGGTHWPANLRPACMKCNALKHNIWPYDIGAHRKEL